MSGGALALLARAVARETLERPGQGRAATGLAAAGAVAAGSATVAAGIGLMAAAGYVVLRAAEAPPILDLTVAFVLVRFFGLARPALRYLERLLSHELTLRMLLLVRSWFYDALLARGPARLVDLRSGDLLSRVAGDVEHLQEAVLRVATPAATAAVVCAGIVTVLAWIDLTLAAAVGALFLAHGALWPWLSLRWARGRGRQRRELRAQVSGRLVSLLHGLEDLTAFGRAGDALREIDGLQDALDRIERAEGRLFAANAAVGTAASGLALAVALGLLIPLVGDGTIPRTWLAAIALGVLAGFEAVEGLPLAWQAREEAAASAGRVAQVLQAGDAPERSGPRTPEPARSAGLGVGLDSVTLRHAGRTVLEDVTLQIEPGRHAAIVGATGAGKSSVLSLVERIWDPQAGMVRVGGVDVRALRLDDLRARVSVVPQQIHVFNRTLRENLLIARPDATDAELREALRQARLEPVVRGLASGLETPLGEFGARLSAGERQRLGLARLFLTDAAVVLADEPTANLDLETEAAVLASLRGWSSGRTLLLVTHRLVGLRTMDRVAVLDRGRLVEEGSTDALLGRNGAYARMLACQGGMI